MSTLCDYQDQLAHKGIVQTDHRLLIFGILTRSPRALSAKEILKEARKSKAIDRVTLYRTLNLFESKKLVKKIVPFRGAVCYEYLSDKHRPAHPHMVCRKCGALECLEELDLKGIERIYLDNRIAHYADIDLKLEGICEDCV